MSSNSTPDQGQLLDLAAELGRDQVSYYKKAWDLNPHTFWDAVAARGLKPWLVHTVMRQGGVLIPEPPRVSRAYKSDDERLVEKLAKRWKKLSELHQHQILDVIGV